MMSAVTTTVLSKLKMGTYARCARSFSILARQFSSEANFPANVPQYSSPCSLDKVYPKSTLSIATPKKPYKEDDKEFSGFIPIEKLQISYSRSSAPGGQHVNKTNTKVSVSFHLDSADWIPAESRLKLAEIHKNNINKSGFWAVKSEKTRAQTLNLADCMDKLRCYITEAGMKAPEPSAESLEAKRENAEKAAAERLRQKRIHSIKKESKRKPSSSDFE